MLAISAIEQIARKNPANAPMYTYIAPAVPPLSNAKDDAVNCASQVAMRTIVKPHIVRKRKLRCSLVNSDSPLVWPAN